MNDETVETEKAGKWKCRGGCGYSADVRWDHGKKRCPGCGGWWNCVKSRADTNTKESTAAALADYKPIPRIPTGIAELDKVLGATTGPDGRPVGEPGLKRNGLYLFGGIKGGGKTSILLQACNKFAIKGRKAYFAPIEMGYNDTLEYCYRLGVKSESVKIGSGDSSVYNIVEDAEAFGADLVIIDSAQTASMDDVNAAEGSKSQIDAMVNYIGERIKKKNYAVILIGHMTNDGDFAGGATFGHLVDCLITFMPVIEEDGITIPVIAPEEVSQTTLREIAIAGKNRGGAAGVSALVEMTPTGLKPVEKKVIRGGWEKFKARERERAKGEGDDDKPKHRGNRTIQIVED